MKKAAFRLGRAAAAWATFGFAAVAITSEWIAGRSAQSSKFFANKLHGGGQP